MLTVNLDIFQVKPGELVLDAGCGTGRHCLELSKKGDYHIYAMDTDRESLLKVHYMINRSFGTLADAAERMISKRIASIPWESSGRASGCRSPMPCSFASRSCRLGLYFIVQLPSG